MLSPEQQRQQVREEIQDIFREAYWFARQHPKRGESVDLDTLTGQQSDQILNLKYESGTPMLAVLDENQPKDVWVRFTVCPPNADMPDEYALVPADQAGWRKTIA